MGKSFDDIIKLYQKRDAEITELENNGYDKSQAKNKVGGLFSYIFKDNSKEKLVEEFETFKSMMTDYGMTAEEVAKDLGDQLSPQIQSYVKSAKNGELTTEGFNKSIGNLSLGAKAGQVALKGLAMAGNMLLILAVTEAINLAVKAISNYVHRLDNAKDTIKYKDSAEDEKNVFYISNGEIYVEPTPVEPEEPTPPIPERELTEEEKAALKEQEFLNAKSYKIDEMSNACEKAIENGVIVGGKAYSYTVQDQSNMLSIVNMAKETGMEVPYHANGEACTLYDYSSIAEIYMEEQMNLMKNQTYFNQLKLYINSITDVNELDTVNGIYYGTKLQGEYLDTYNKIIAQSEQIMSKLVLIEARSL